MTVEKKVWIYDLEQFENFHSATFVGRDNPEEMRQFVIHELRNDLTEYINFLKTEVSGLIGFNCINYDYPLLHLLINLAEYTTDIDGLLILLNEESKKLINNDEYTNIPDKYVKIPQLDLYKIHHFDNKAKITSLKAVEIAIRFPNVQDLPLISYVETEEEIQEILSYNLNDVLATREFYFMSVDMIDLRKRLGAKYKINLRNANDPKIGEEIFGRAIAKKKGWRYSSLKDMRTYRPYINLGDCVLDKIKFESEEFNRILNFFKNKTVTTTYKPFEESVIYKGFKYDYGVGGLHGCIESGIYKSDDKYAIYDIDVASYYPSLAIQNGFYPRHLGRDFVDVYKELFDTRMEAKKQGDHATNSGLKLALNGVYGKSNSQYSLFYDPMYTMQITINGQLFLSMLSERFVNEIKDIQILQINTDGITVRIPRNQADIDHMHFICETWEDYTGFTLESNEYKMMIIRDVNNYLAVDIDDKAKPKGCFEIIPMQNGAVAYNKNWSMRIVPKTLHAHYINNIPVDQFVKNHTNIYDFCIGFRSKSPWHIYESGMEKINDNEYQKFHRRQQHTIRYYMSKGGVILTKENYKDGRIISLESGKTATMFNRYYSLENFSDYNIDYNYYINEIKKITYAVDDGQLKIF